MSAQPQQHIDPAEIQKFAEYAEQWWDIDGPCKPLHALNPYRLQFIMQHTDLKNKNVVDVGCGGGILTEALQQEGAKATGLDACEQSIAIAKQHANQEKLTIDYLTDDVLVFAEQHPDAFDVLTCMEMLEHVPNPSSVIKACAVMTKPGGWLFFSTLNRNLTAYLKAIVGAEYLLKLLPKGTHDYQKFIQPAEFARWARHEGLSLIELAGINYQPFTQQFSLTPDVDVNYLVACQKQ